MLTPLACQQLRGDAPASDVSCQHYGLEIARQLGQNAAKIFGLKEAATRAGFLQFGEIRSYRNLTLLHREREHSSQHTQFPVYARIARPFFLALYDVAGRHLSADIHGPGAFEKGVEMQQPNLSAFNFLRLA